MPPSGFPSEHPHGARPDQRTMMNIARCSLALLAACVTALCGCEDVSLCTTCPQPSSDIRGSIEGDYGQPVDGLIVVVSGKAPVTCGADGSFRVAGVGGPYDLTLLSTSERRVVVYRGLARRDL